MTAPARADHMGGLRVAAVVRPVARTGRSGALLDAALDVFTERGYTDAGLTERALPRPVGKAPGGTGAPDHGHADRRAQPWLDDPIENSPTPLHASRLDRRPFHLKATDQSV